MDGVETARAAGVGELILTHHDPARTDDQVDQLVDAARASFPKVRAAASNMVLVS